MKTKWTEIEAVDCGKTEPTFKGIYIVKCPHCNHERDVYVAKAIGAKRAKQFECSNCEIKFKVLKSGKVFFG